MSNTSVALLADGTFTIRSTKAGMADFNVTLNFDDPIYPWVAHSCFGEPEVWTESGCFQSLDAAMEFAVSQVQEDGEFVGYGMSLPCGQFISRPGKVKLEDVMASYGWIFVTHIRGYSPHDFRKNATIGEVEDYFTKLTDDTLAFVENVDHCQVDDNDGTLWLADVLIPVEGLMYIPHMQKTCGQIFEDEGVPALGDFEYFTRTNVCPNDAKIIDITDILASRKSEKISESLTAKTC